MVLNTKQKIAENVISGHVIDAAIEVHTQLGGPGLLERVYEEALFAELCLRDIPVQRQVSIPIQYIRNDSWSSPAHRPCSG